MSISYRTWISRNYTIPMYKRTRWLPYSSASAIPHVIYYLIRRIDCGWRNHETGEVKSYYPYFDPDQHNEYAFSGIHVLSPKILELMEEWTGKFSIINFYLAICAKTDIRAYMADNLKLLDIGKPETLAAAEEWLRQNI